MASSSVLNCSSVSLPFSSEMRSGSHPRSIKVQPLQRRQMGRIKARAAGGDRRDNLDHLQKLNNPQTKQQKKGEVPQVSAPIGLWDRFPTARTVQQMMETMERMMEDPLAYSATWPSVSQREEVGGYRRGRTPWEIKEVESEYKMRFDIPGMTKEDVKLWVEDKMLVVKAEKMTKTGEEGAESGGDWSPKSYGKYSSRIALPENVEFEKIKAEVKDGVLYITIPKAVANSKILDIQVR